MVLDISSASKDDRARLIVHPYHGGENQRFKFEPNGTIRAVHSGKVLDVEDGMAQGHNIIQYTSHGGSNQRWAIHRDGTIRLDGQNLCIGIQGGSREKGANLIAWACNGQPDQKWRLATSMG